MNKHNLFGASLVTRMVLRMIGKHSNRAIMDRIDVYMELYETTEEENHIMLVIWMINALAIVGIPVSIAAMAAAMKRQGESGRYETRRDAAEDCETWAIAYEIQEEMSHTGR